MVIYTINNNFLQNSSNVATIFIFDLGILNISIDAKSKLKLKG